MGNSKLIVFIVSCISLAIAYDDSCPDPQYLKPCTCDGEGANCMGPVTLSDIRRAFSAKFKYGGVRAIWIQGTTITSAPSDLIGQLKVQELYIEVNNMTSIDMRLVDGSRDTLSVLSLFGNQLTTVDYSAFANLKVLYTLNLGRNKLTQIPDNAFGESYGLSTLILAQNQITSVGRNAFAKLHNLQRLELVQNQIKTLGPLSFVNDAPNLMVNLVYNRIDEVSPTAFNGTTPAALRLAVNQLTSLTYDAFGPLITRMGQRGAGIEVSSNPFTCKGCDYSWIVANKQPLSYVLLGFLCRDGTTLQQLTKEKIGC